MHWALLCLGFSDNIKQEIWEVKKNYFIIEYLFERLVKILKLLTEKLKEEDVNGN